MSPIEIYALAAVALFLKIFAVSLVQGVTRMKSKTFVKPEDARAFGDGVAADAEDPLVDRGQRTLRNDMENIPIFLVLGWVYVSLDLWHLGAAIYFGLFVLSRITHTAAYLLPTQPLRTLAYMSGILVCFALSTHIIWHVIGG